MRTLSTPTTDAAIALVTQPGVLVEIGFDTPLRLSSRGDVAVLGNDWTAWSVRVSGLSFDPAKPASGGAVVLGDHDQSITALVLGEGVAGREVRVWRYFAEAIDADDPVMVFSGLAGAASGGADRSVSIALVARESTTRYSPRRYMTRETGFSAIPAAGKKLTFNGQLYELKPER